jgi:CubicO group peptidase (beta-lactamase class C family)
MPGLTSRGNTVKQLWLLMMGFVTACSAASAAPPVERMDQIARYYVDAKQFSGAVLVARGEQVLFSKAYGLANVEWDAPNTVNTRFRIGSVTKQFTAVAMLLLAERGKLKLDDLVKKHYPEAPAAWDQITLLQILSHTAGIPNYTELPDLQVFSAAATTPEALVSRFRDLPLTFAPGTQMRYSNSGYALAGLILEKASGMSYAKFLEENLFKPLGLKDTGYESAIAISPRRAAGYAMGAGGVENASYVNMTVPFAAGALYSTVEDLQRWNLALYGGRVLKPASLSLLTTPVKGEYALGIGVSTRAGKRVFEHSGGINGFNSKLSYYPDDQISVVALSNLNGPGADAIVDNLGKLVNGEKVVLPTERKVVSVPKAVLEQYVGGYELGPNFVLTFTVEGNELISQATGQPKFPLRAESETKFYVTAFEAEIEFQKDASGKVTGLVLRQNGRDRPAPRIKGDTPK